VTAKVVVRYAETHPEHMHEPLMWLAIVALHDAWPCLSTDFDKRRNHKPRCPIAGQVDA
jgi:hypothetical protein